MNEGNNIKMGRLPLGEVVIGRYNETEDALEDVLTLQARPLKDTNQLQMSMVPFMYPFTDKPAPLVMIDDLLAVQDPPEDMAHKYVEIISGTVMPTTGNVANLNRPQPPEDDGEPEEE